jgi:hypothetical protein
MPVAIASRVWSFRIDVDLACAAEDHSTSKANTVVVIGKHRASTTSERDVSSGGEHLITSDQVNARVLTPTTNSGSITVWVVIASNSAS